MARLDTTVAQIALRSRALTLEVCTTGSTTLGKSALGYTRQSGSFVVDGFYAGQEIAPSGFESTDRSVITQVTAWLLKVREPFATTQAEATGRSISVGFPYRRLFENRDEKLSDDLAPYIEEEYIPRPVYRLTAPDNGGTLVESGLWVVKWYGLQGYDVPAIRKGVDALLGLFTLGTSITAGQHTLRVGTYQGSSSPGVPSGPGPYAGQLLRSGSYMACTVNIPVWAFTTNSIAA